MGGLATSPIFTQSETPLGAHLLRNLNLIYFFIKDSRWQLCYLDSLTHFLHILYFNVLKMSNKPVAIEDVTGGSVNATHLCVLVHGVSNPPALSSPDDRLWHVMADHHFSLL